MWQIHNGTNWRASVPTALISYTSTQGIKFFQQLPWKKLVAQGHALQDMVSVRRLHDLPTQRCQRLGLPALRPNLPRISGPNFFGPSWTHRPTIHAGYVSNRCGLAHVSTKLIGHKFEPQFAAHPKLDQEHFSSSNAGPCKLIGCNCDGSWPKFPTNKRITNVKKNHEPPTFIWSAVSGQAAPPCCNLGYNLGGPNRHACQEPSQRNPDGGMLGRSSAIKF